MPVLHFNSKSLDALKAKKGQSQVDYWDKSFSYFGLRVSGTGRKTWNVMYVHQGRLRRMTLGLYGDAGLSLADARRRAKEIHSAAAKGLDPATMKKDDRDADVYSELVALYLAWAEKNKSSWTEDKRILNRDVLPSWKSQKAKDITRKDVIHLLDGIVKRGAPVHANRTLALIRRVFNFGIEKDIVQYNPCTAVKKPSKESPRDRVLTPAEIRAVWVELDNEESAVAAIVKFQFLTGQRPGEVCCCQWSEIDLESKVWTIPSEKSKNGLAHRVPLSEGAVALLQSLRISAPTSKWLFPSDRGTDSHILSPQKLIERIRQKMGFGFTAHDIRRSVASHMTGMGIPRLVVSKILNHVESGVTRVYDRHSYDQEKRAALAAWNENLNEITKGKNASTVIQFPNQAYTGTLSAKKV